MRSRQYLSSIAFFAAGLFLLLSPRAAHALTLTPIRFEISGDPGQTLVEQVTLTNELKTSETYYLSFENFEAEGETGSPTFVPATDDLGTWMNAPDSVTLTPGESTNVPVTIAIPKDAEPGGHFAGVFWGTTPKVDAGGQVAVSAKTGVLVLLSVSGNITENGGILEFATNNKQTFYTSLPVDFYYRFENGGSDRIKPTGSIFIKDTIGLTATKLDGNPIEGNILPRSVRKIPVSWEGQDVPDPAAPPAPPLGFFDMVRHEWRNFAFGHYTADLELSYGTKGQVAQAAFGFWVVPWQLAIVVIVIALLLYLIIRTGARHYNRWVIGRAEAMMEAHLQRQGPLDPPVESAPRAPRAPRMPRSPRASASTSTVKRRPRV